MQCSPMWTPSTSSATRSSASSAVDRQAASCAAVFATKRRLTALLLVPRTWHIGAAPAPSCGAYWRVATPTSICSTTRRFSGSVVGERLKRRQRRLPRRRRGPAAGESATFRPPSTTSLGTVPARDAARSA